MPDDDAVPQDEAGTDGAPADQAADFGQVDKTAGSSTSEPAESPEAGAAAIAELSHNLAKVVDEATKVYSRADFPITTPVEWYGRGGTDMKPAINWVREHSKRFDWCILVSDMEWEIRHRPESVPYTGLPTVYLAVNHPAVKPPHPNTHALSVDVAA